MTDRFFWIDTAERAAKSTAQAALLAIGAAQVDVFSADWQTIAGFALGGGVLSVLTSLASLKIGPEDSPSVVR